MVAGGAVDDECALLSGGWVGPEEGVCFGVVGYAVVIVLAVWGVLLVSGAVAVCAVWVAWG